MMKKIDPLERMLHCVKIDKFKKMTLYTYIYKYVFSDGSNNRNRNRG